MKVAIIDLETTGTDADVHEIVDIGAVVFDSSDPLSVETLDMRVLPKHIETAAPAALKVNGYDEKEWKETAFALEVALHSLQKIADGAIFMSYNVTFDWSFIARAYKNSTLRNPFNYHKLCLMTMAWARMPQAQSLKLKDICTSLGIPPEPEIHKALNGAKRAHEVYKRILT